MNAPTSRKKPVKGKPVAPVRAGKAKNAGLSAASAEHRIKLFVEAFLSNGENITEAALAAGFSPKSAASQGSRLLKNVKVQQELDSRRKKTLHDAQEKTGISVERVLQEAWSVATADPRELVEYHIGCCRFCWGEGNRYQRTANELERDEQAHTKLTEDLVAAGKPAPGAFDQKGGIGFNSRKPPNKDCPECFGVGIGATVLNDTRNISTGAASLYAGIKETRDGFEVKLHSKLDGIEKLFKHLGLYERDNEQRNPSTFLEAMLNARARATAR